MNGRPVANGVWTTMITPFTQDNKIDYPALKQMIDWYDRCGVDGLFAVCLSSEMYHLSLEERVALSDFVVKNAPAHMGVVSSGHVSDNIDDQIEELQKIAATNPDAVILVANRLAAENETDEVWKRNAQTVMDNLPGVTLGLYECPLPYHRLLSPELLRWCAETGRFTYIKETSCDVEAITAKLAAVKGTPLKIYTADTATLLDSMKAGAAGYCGVFGNVRPELYHPIVRRWQQDDAAALRAQHLASVISLVGGLMYPVCAKYHMSLDGVGIGLTTRNRDYLSFSKLDKLLVQHLHAFLEETLTGA